jgi:uncharacterized protein (DUF1684 family)
MLWIMACADQTEQPHQAIANLAAWEASIIEARQEKDVTFKTSPTSPMAGVKRLTVNADKKMYVIKKDREMSLSPDHVHEAQLSLLGRNGRWIWVALKADVTCRVDDRMLAPGAELPGHALFNVMDFTLSAYPSPEALTLIIFDPKRPELKRFSHLYYFEPDPAYAIRATLEKYTDMAQVTMLTSQNLQKTFYRYAQIKFSLEGRALALSAFKSALKGPGSDILFMPFKDSTSAKETYGGGRFLDIPEPAADDFVLDFNNAYNPLCSYSPAYNCPLPPDENILDAPVRAGEKTYPH